MGYLKKSASTFVTQVLKIVLGMIASIMIARILGPVLKGKVVLLMTVLQLLFMVGNLGFGSAFTYHIAKGKHKADEIISLAFITAIMLGAMMVGLFFLSFPFHQSLWTGISFNALLLCILLTPIYIFHNNLLRIIMGFNKIYEMNACEFLFASLNLFALFFFVWYLGSMIIGVLVSQYIATFGSLFLLIFLLRKKISWIFSVNVTLLKECFNYGIKTYLLLLINFLNYRADLFLLKHFRTDLEVGYYSLAVGIAELIWLIPNSTVATLFPTIATSNKKDKSVITLQTCRWSLLILLVLSIGIVFLGKIMIILLYGEAYLPSYVPLIYLLPGIFLFPVYKLLVIDIAARGHPEYGTMTSFVALIVNVILNLVLIPRFGTVGAAIATSVSYIVMSLLSLYFFVSLTEHHIKEIFLIPADEQKFVLQKLLSFVTKRKVT